MAALSADNSDENLLNHLPYGKILDFPISETNSQFYFGNDIKMKQRLSYKLDECELFNVICDDRECVRQQTLTRFNTRMSYSNWMKNHHCIKHKNKAKLFIVVSFWSTLFNGHGLHTEYRLISLKSYQYLKPLTSINNNKTTTTTKVSHCGYCHDMNATLSRCGGCKILFYCSKHCQTKHWHLIHKMQCKKLKIKYKNKDITLTEIEELEKEEMVKFTKLSTNYYGKAVDDFKEMMNERGRKDKSASNDELLFDNDGSEHCILVNRMMSVVIDAFDRDGDRKLNYNEWKSMLNELGFRRWPRFISCKQFYYDICSDLGLLKHYEPSLNNGIYGSYINPDFDKNDIDILFGAKEIMETLRYCAWIRSRCKSNDDDDFKGKYDFYDEDIAMNKAFLLLFKLYGHAQGIVCLGEARKEDIFDLILESVPYLNDDIISIIYNYITLTGQNIINISWHRIKWLTLKEDEKGLWELYDIKSNNMYYDICYLSKQDENGYDDISIQFEICHDKEKCDDKLRIINNNSLFGHTVIDMEERANPKKRWCLGLCPSYIPNYSFQLKQHAMLIGKVLKFHNLNPKLCHYIYVGVGIRCDTKNKSKIVKAFNQIYDAKTKYRSHGKKKPMLSGLNSHIFNMF